LVTPVSSTNTTDRYDINEILLKVVLNTITLTHFCGNVWAFLVEGFLLFADIYIAVGDPVLIKRYH
jgi:hypothetical protein